MNVPELLFKLRDITGNVPTPALHPQIKIIPSGSSGHQGAARAPWALYLGNIVIILVITFVVCNGRWVGVWARGDEILITEFDFIMTGGVTVIFCNRAQ